MNYSRDPEGKSTTMAVYFGNWVVVQGPPQRPTVDIAYQLRVTVTGADRSILKPIGVHIFGQHGNLIHTETLSHFPTNFVVYGVTPGSYIVEASGVAEATSAVGPPERPGGSPRSVTRQFQACRRFAARVTVGVQISTISIYLPLGRSGC